MELTNEFRVPLPVERAWAVLTDVERIAPCMPGAQLTEVEGDEYRGTVKVKVGPITAQYRGTASFVEKDDASYRAVLRAEGRDTRGQGNASATVTATLTAADGGTLVQLTTDLTVTGKVAQFGRGVMADVSTKLLGQFVECLETTVLAEETATPEPIPVPATVGAPSVGDASGNGHATVRMQTPLPPTPSAEVTSSAASDAPVEAAGPTDSSVPSESVAASSGGARKIDAPEAEPVDLLDAAGVPMAKRAIPVVAGVLVLVWFLRRRRRRR